MEGAPKAANAVQTSEDGSPADKRRAPRFSYIDTAQYFLPRVEGRTKARTADVSRTGCYLETLNALPPGTRLLVRLSLGGRVFEANGVVAHSQPNMGMGIDFVEVTPENQAVLDAWLAEMNAD